MPKTFTDDIAPALPSSIDGPFQVVDAADSSSWIKVDPANAQIAAAGGARPLKRMIAPYARSYLVSGQTVIAMAISARYVNTGYVGGFYVTALRIPDELDVTQPLSIRTLVSTLVNSSTTGEVVRFSLEWARITTTGVQISNNVTYDWPAPDNWQTSETNVALIDNGSGWTIDGNTFAAGEFLGLRISRLGTDPADTYSTGVRFAEMLMLDYTAKAF